MAGRIILKRLLSDWQLRFVSKLGSLFPAQISQPDPGVDFIDNRMLRPCPHLFSLLSGTTYERGLLAHLQGPFGVQEAVELNGLGHEPGPAGLVAGAEPGAIVAVEVLVKEDVIAPVGVGLELLRAAVDGSPAAFTAEKDVV
jgi:hypothetical protein